MAKFKCLNSKSVCEFYGTINDSIEFSKFSDLILANTVIDFSNVDGASWSGLTRFVEYLGANPEKNFVLTKLSLPIYRQLKLLLQKSKNIGIGEVEVKVVSMADSSSKQTFFKSQDLFALLAKEGSFAKVDNSIVLGSLLHHCKPFLKGTEFEKKQLFELITAEDRSEYAFWFLYLSFLHATTCICLDYLTNLHVSLVEHFTQTDQRIAACKKGVTMLGLDASEIPGGHNAEVVAEQFGAIQAQLSTVQDQLEAAMSKLQIGMIEKKLEREEVFSLVQNCLRTRNEMTSIAVQLEDRGSLIAYEAMPMACGATIQSMLENFTPPAGVNLMTVCETFNILDPFAGESWETLRPEIENELGAIDSVIMQVVFELQGFDAVRQILEQRVKECAEGDDGITKRLGFVSDFESVKTQLLNKVSSKLVTEQEKRAYEYFLIDYKERSLADIPTGDVSFF